MKTKLVHFVSMVLIGLVAGSCVASESAKQESPAETQTEFVYSTNEDGVTAKISGYVGSSPLVRIPATINGLRVTCIAARAFWANTRVTSVVIPDSVTTVGEDAFSAVDSPGSSITNLVIGNGVTTIEGGAFVFCGKLTSVRIPKSVSNIGTMAFGGCFGLKSIVVDPGNADYSSLDGVLYNKNQTELVQYPPGKVADYIIPDTVTDIADYALWNCPGLTGIVIPEGVTIIKKECFAACYDLTRIEVPASVTNIEVYAFNSCESLKSVYFHGNAPSLPEGGAFAGGTAVVYYLPGTEGWENTYEGQRTAIWKP